MHDAACSCAGYSPNDEELYRGVAGYFRIRGRMRRHKFCYLPALLIVILQPKDQKGNHKLLPHGIRENSSRFDHQEPSRDNNQQTNNNNRHQVNSQHLENRTATRQSGMFNKGSSGTSDIITWDNKQESHGQASSSSISQRLQTGAKMDARDRKLVEEQLTELDLQVEKANIELNGIVAQQPKTGVTMKKKRELEDRLEVLEKQRAGLRSRLRMGLNNR